MAENYLRSRRNSSDRRYRATITPSGPSIVPSRQPMPARFERLRSAALVIPQAIQTTTRNRKRIVLSLLLCLPFEQLAGSDVQNVAQSVHDAFGYSTPFTARQAVGCREANSAIGILGELVRSNAAFFEQFGDAQAHVPKYGYCRLLTIVPIFGNIVATKSRPHSRKEMTDGSETNPKARANNVTGRWFGVKPERPAMPSVPVKLAVETRVERLVTSEADQSSINVKLSTQEGQRGVILDIEGAAIRFAGANGHKSPHAGVYLDLRDVAAVNGLAQALVSAIACAEKRGMLTP
jgi:hypothetical protein